MRKCLHKSSSFFLSHHCAMPSYFQCHCSHRELTCLSCHPHWNPIPSPYPRHQPDILAMPPLSRLVRGSWDMQPKDVFWGSCQFPICKMGHPSHKASLFWNWPNSLRAMRCYLHFGSPSLLFIGCDLENERICLA